MRTRVFLYKNKLGIESHPEEAEGLINKPLDPGQLGFVLDASKVDFQQEAINWMKNLATTGDDIGDVDAFKTDDGKVIFAWLGGPMTAIGSNHITPCTSDFDLLIATEFETPQDFKEFIDTKYTEK